MKKNSLVLSCFVLAAALTACSGSDSGSTTNSDTTTSSTTSTSSTTTPSDSNGAASMTDTSQTTSATPMGSSASKTPLGKDDSTFAMKAAVGGMTEVESGKVAQQNGQSDRVKSYGSMMVNDHTAANQELMSLASNKGLTLPTALPADAQKHVDAMKAMKGKSFDSHYVSMMLSDHKKDVAEFEKESKNGKDADLKAWATKTLPTLRAHLDSIQAISKAKM